MFLRWRVINERPSLLGENRILWGKAAMLSQGKAKQAGFCNCLSMALPLRLWASYPPERLQLHPRTPLPAKTDKHWYFHFQSRPGTLAHPDVRAVFADIRHFQYYLILSVYRILVDWRMFKRTIFLKYTQLLWEWGNQFYDESDKTMEGIVFESIRTDNERNEELRNLMKSGLITSM